MEYKDSIHFCDPTNRGVNIDITIQEIVEILVTIQTSDLLYQLPAVALH